MHKNTIISNKKTGISPDLKNFESYLKERNVSSHTARAYLGAIRQFLEMFPEPDADSAETYKQYLLNHYKPRTVNLRICALNSYMVFLQTPSAKLPTIQITKNLSNQNIISPSDYEYLKKRLLDENRIRYYFAVRLMAETGMRGSSIVELQVDDVKRGYLVSDTAVRISQDLQRQILTWLRKEGRTEGYVFLNRFGNPMTTTGLREQLKDYAKSYGMDPSTVHPLAFRYFFIQNSGHQE